MAEIVPVTSEALEAQVRDLLPSQRGFGEDLQASNVITPIIDLTAAAQGTTTPELLQTALAFGSQTAFSASGTSVVVANSPGFYRIFGVSNCSNGTATVSNTITMTDGLTVKQIYRHFNLAATGNPVNTSIEFDFVVFLASGESISVTSSAGQTLIAGSSRQIADVNGNLIDPSGFTPQ